MYKLKHIKTHFLMIYQSYKINIYLIVFGDENVIVNGSFTLIRETKSNL